jgi:hypothetical protein
MRIAWLGLMLIMRGEGLRMCLAGIMREAVIYHNSLIHSVYICVARACDACLDLILECVVGRLGASLGQDLPLDRYEGGASGAPQRVQVLCPLPSPPLPSPSSSSSSSSTTCSVFPLGPQSGPPNQPLQAKQGLDKPKSPPTP